MKIIRLHSSALEKPDLLTKGAIETSENEVKEKKEDL